MTDQHEPEQRRPATPPPDRGMPVAGRRPDNPPSEIPPAPAERAALLPAEARQPVGEGPTRPLKRFPESSPPPTAPDRTADEPTRIIPLAPAGASASDVEGDEPTPGTPASAAGATATGDQPRVAEGDEPTLVTPPDPDDAPPVSDRRTGTEKDEPAPPIAPAAAAEPAGRSRREDDDVTRRLTLPAGATSAPTGPTVDEEPTVERPTAPTAASDVGEVTRRLVPLGEGFTGPEPDRHLVVGPAPDADPAGEPADGPEPVPGDPGGANGPDAADPAASRDVAISDTGAGPVPGDAPAVPTQDHPPRKRLSSAGALIWVLLALFGFTLVVQLRSNNTDEGLASARQEDLVRILSDLEARDTRLQAEIAALESSQRQLTSGVAGRRAALAEADKRADELGLLAGTLPGRGPGLEIRLTGVKASEILNAVQELRGAGGEVMELDGANGGRVRIVASSYFMDAEGGGIVVDGTRLAGPYTLWVIGMAQTMQTALEIPGGVVASVKNDGGNVTIEQRASVEVTAVRKPTSLQYARPVS